MSVQITHVAIVFMGGVYSLPSPARHCDVIRHIVNTTEYDSICVDMDREQGFLDSAGEFLDRSVAYGRARGNGQLLGSGHLAGTLFSEDLW